jgi:CxxC-x17-CxxC domain-containing protein
MSDYNRGGHKGGKKSFGNKSFGDKKDFNNREMHKAKCTDCGAECEVPFKPTPGKPVRCRDCFRKKKTY